VKRTKQSLFSLNSIKEQIENQLNNVNQSITLDEIELLGRTKIAATISTPHLMGSIEILEDLAIELLIIEFDNEELVNTPYKLISCFLPFYKLTANLANIL